AKNSSGLFRMNHNVSLKSLRLSLLGSTSSPRLTSFSGQNNPDTYGSHIQTNGLATGTSFGLAVSAGTNANDASINARNQSGTSMLLVRGDGLIGIGTTNPQGLLHISSNSTASTAFVVENIFNAQSRQLIVSNYGNVGGGLYWTGLDSANTSSLL